MSGAVAAGFSGRVGLRCARAVVATAVFAAFVFAFAAFVLLVQLRLNQQQRKHRGCGDAHGGRVGDTGGQLDHLADEGFVFFGVEFQSGAAEHAVQPQQEAVGAHPVVPMVGGEGGDDGVGQGVEFALEAAQPSGVGEVAPAVGQSGGQQVAQVAVEVAVGFQNVERYVSPCRGVPRRGGGAAEEPDEDFGLLLRGQGVAIK